MEQEILKKLEENSQKLDKVYRSSERMRKYFLWTLIITLIFILLPLFGLLIVVPQFLNTVAPSGF